MIGKTISHYKILEKLGEGGMGVVYRARDIKLDRDVALKFLPPGISAEEEERKRFIHEAKAASRLDDPNICTIYEIEETDDGQIFIVMGYYEGENLKSRIRKGLDFTTAVDIAVQAARGLDKAHKKGIVHRDIKPANILVTTDGVVKILDFGLAKLSGQTKLTKTGTTFGTVAYMSPEQAKGESVDHRSDIWSLGVLFFEMAAGYLPFKGEYDQAMMYAIVNQEPEPLTGLRTRDPLTVETIIQRALSKDPSKRYQNCGEMLADLSRLKESQTSPVQRPRRPKQDVVFKTRGRAVWFLASGMSIIVILAVYLMIRFDIFRKSISHPPELSPWKNSIAVLPFVDMSPDKDQEYFCDGMADDLITKLTRIQELKVIARTSSFQYRNTEKSIMEIAGELGVNTILEGSIQKEEDRIRVNVQLIHAEDAAHLWANTYDENVESVFNVQDRITSAITEALQLRLQSQTEKQERRPADFEVYDYYLKGMHFIKTKYTISLNMRDYETGLRMFHRAIEKDSTYALAYVGLSWAHYHHYVNTGDVNAYKLWEQDNQKAYRLDPANPVTIASMGLLSMEHHRHQDAARFFKDALRLNADNAVIQQTIGFSFHYYGLHHKALKYLKRSMVLDPYYIWSRAQLAICLENLGRMEEAEIYLKQNIELAPNDRRHYLYYANHCIKMKRFEEAAALLEEAKKMELSSPDMPMGNISLYNAYLLTKTDRFEEVLELSVQPDAKIYSMLGKTDDAVDFIQSIINKRKTSKYWDLLNNPYYDNLREDSRFLEIIEQEKKKHDRLTQIFGGL
jgi:serine/threonine protein kinase/tetratricopeptide (TPR) repeat protein